MYLLSFPEKVSFALLSRSVYWGFSSVSLFFSLSTLASDSYLLAYRGIARVLVFGCFSFMPVKSITAERMNRQSQLAIDIDSTCLSAVLSSAGNTSLSLEPEWLFDKHVLLLSFEAAGEASVLRPSLVLLALHLWLSTPDTRG